MDVHVQQDADPRAREQSHPPVSWGLGLEHEFLIEVDGRVVPSTSVFPLPSKQPETLASVKVSVEAVLKTTSTTSTTSVKSVKVAKLALDLLRDSNAIVDPDVRAMAFASRSPRDVVTRVRDKIASNTAAGGASFLLDVWEGDTLAVIHLAYQGVRLLVIPSARRGRMLTSLEVWDAVAAATRSISPARAAAAAARSDSHPPELDGDFIEVRSDRPIHATVRGVATQIRDQEAAVLRRAKLAHPEAKSVRLFPWSGYVAPTGTPEYAGSYHMWVTMPHATSTSGLPSDMPATLAARRTVVRQHAAMAHLLQWMEPLFLCTYTGDPRAAPGNRYRRASMRASLNPLSGYGTTPAHRMLLSPPTTRGSASAGVMSELVWFSNEADLLALHSPNMVRDMSWPLLVRSGGDLVPFETCIDMDRYAAHTYRAEPAEMSRMLRERERERRLFGWDSDFAELYTDLESGTKSSTKSTGETPSEVMQGADVRSKLCSSLSLPLKRGWTTAWVVGRDGKSLEARFVDAARSVVVEDIPLDADEWRDVLTRGATGIEFRAIDNFPSEGIEAFARTVVLVAAAATAWDEATSSATAAKTPRKTPRKTQTPWMTGVTADALLRHASGTSPSWKAAMRAVELGGSHATLPPEYVASLKAHLGLPVNSPLPLDAYGTLCSVVDSLHARYRRHPVTAQLDRENVREDAGPPVVVNYNEQAMAMAMSAK